MGGLTPRGAQPLNRVRGLRRNNIYVYLNTRSIIINHSLCCCLYRGSYSVFGAGLRVATSTTGSRMRACRTSTATTTCPTLTGTSSVGILVLKQIFIYTIRRLRKRATGKHSLIPSLRGKLNRKNPGVSKQQKQSFQARMRS